MFTRVSLLIFFHLLNLNCLHPQVASTALAPSHLFSIKSLLLKSTARDSHSYSLHDQQTHRRRSNARYTCYLRLDLASDVMAASNASVRLYVLSVCSQTVEVYGSRNQVLQASYDPLGLACETNRKRGQPGNAHF